MTTKAALILVLATWISAAVIGIASRVVFNYLVLAQLDRELDDVATDFQAILKNEAYPFDDFHTTRWNRRISIHPVYRFFLNLMDEDGKVLWSSITAPSQLQDVNFKLPTVQVVDTYRLVHKEIGLKVKNSVNESRSDSGLKPAILQVGCSSDLATTAMRELDRWIFPLAVGLFLLAPPLAWVVARWLLAPLQRLSKATDTIKLSEDRLIDRNNNRDEIDRLAETINGLLVRTRSQLRDNEDWLANSAHQLRGPLAAIMSNVEVVSNRVTDGKTGEMLDKVATECNYLNKIINQLLLLGETKYESKGMVRQAVAWDKQVEQAVNLFEALASEKGIEMEMLRCDPTIVQANPVYLRFVIQNLLENAIKYTESGGRVEVSLTCDQTTRKGRLEIKDTGMGISKLDQEKIGRRFFRSNTGRNHSTTPRGSGLGLSIVLNIVESLKGVFSLQSELGKGTTIAIELPIESTTHASVPAEVGKVNWLKSHRI